MSREDALAAALIVNFESVWLLKKQRILDTESWRKWDILIRTVVSLDFVRKFWNSDPMRKQELDSSFATFLDNLIKN
jgi:hypothetical protein